MASTSQAPSVIPTLDGERYRSLHAAAAPDGQITEIRSVALTVGPARIHREQGVWALSAWPWLNSGGDQVAMTRLLNMETNRVVTVRTTGAELVTCSPTWCRVLVMNGHGLARIDLMRPDGTARQGIAGSAASAAVTDARSDLFVRIDRLRYRMYVGCLDRGHRAVRVAGGSRCR